MDNENIKEILDNLKNIEDYLSFNEASKLEDYITNLQQENHELKSKLECYENGAYYSSKVDELEQENEKLKEENKHIFANVNDDELLISNAMNYAEARDYKSRCEKASKKLSFIDEALENDTLNVPLCITKINSALNILQNGSESQC